MCCGRLYSPNVTNAVKAQAHLGPDFLLRGLLDKRWLTAICATDNDKPLVKLMHIYIGLWRILFASVWETRNNILHGKGSIAEKYERKRLIAELAEWKRTALHMLGSKQWQLASYSMQDAIRWSTPLMKETLRTLATAARNFKNHTDGCATQTRLTDFFHKVGNSDIDTLLTENA